MAAQARIVHVPYYEDIWDRLRWTPSLVAPDRLREGQFGALSALVAHVTASDEPAQLVLPTGVGKTVVAVLAPYLLRSRRALIVVPGKLIRSQVVAAIRDTERLAAMGVLPRRARAPKIGVAEHRATVRDWQTWESCDVVVGTPSVLSPAYDQVAKVPRELFDLVVFDEAHHLPATTWAAMLGAMDARAVLLTATPFRNDGKRLPGHLAFTYPLARAIDQGVFGAVRYVPIDEVEGEGIDQTIARAAAQRLNSSEHVEAQSRLLVRSDSVKEAHSLRAVYEAQQVPLGVIVHDTSWRAAQKMTKQVEAGELMGFVCVGALTEGFDFPALKVGAYHAPHKTLGPTIQFIGRLSRIGEIDGELLAPRSAVTGETAALYREDVGWRKLLPDLVDSAIDYERQVRRFVQDSLIEGDLNLPALSLMPTRTVHVYRSEAAPDLAAKPERIAGAHVVQRIVHDESQTIAFVTSRTQRPRFMKLDLLDVPIFELHLVTWVEEDGILFVSTTTKAALRDLRGQLGIAKARSLSSSELRRILDAAHFQRFFSIGTRAARAQATTSYQTRAGSQADADLTPADARGWDLGHAMGRSGDGLFGFSVAQSKIWEPGAANSLFAFRQWCEEQAQAVTNPAQHHQSKLDLFAIPEVVGEFPADPIAAVWPASVYAGFDVVIDGELFQPEMVELIPDSSASDRDSIVIRLVVEDDERARMTYSLDGSIAALDRDVNIRERATGDITSVADLLTDDPLTLFFGTGARVTGDRIAAPPPSAVPIAEVVLKPRDWVAETSIRVEFDEPADGLESVGVTTSRLLAGAYPIVIQDHLRGEIADFVAIDNSTLFPRVALAHCKASGGDIPAVRVTDLQELAAQGIRSVQWLAPGSDLWIELRRRLDHRDATRVIAGDEATVKQLLDDWSAQAPPAEWAMWLVQPGLAASRLDAAPSVASLLNAVHYWLASQQVELTLLCSA
jgi:superfamily II DNA or RNA helicase